MVFHVNRRLLLSGGGHRGGLDVYPVGAAGHGRGEQVVDPGPHGDGDHRGAGGHGRRGHDAVEVVVQPGGVHAASGDPGGHGAVEPDGGGGVEPVLVDRLGGGVVGGRSGGVGHLP